MMYPQPPDGYRPGEGNPYLPAYTRIAQSIREDIENGTYGLGDMLPSEPRLAASHKASIGTVKKALQVLVSEGFVYRMQGKGTFVGGNFIRSTTLRFYRTQEAFGSADPAPAAVFLSRSFMPALAEANRALGIADTAELLFLERMICINGKPAALVHSFFEKKRFRKLFDVSPERFEREALTLIIEHEFDTPTLSTNELTSVCIPDDDGIALRLGQAPGTALLLIEMLSFSYKNIPYEYRRSYCAPGFKFFRQY